MFNLKNIKLIIVFLLGSLSINAQTISIDGFVTDVFSGFPVQDQLVVIGVNEGGIQQDYEFYTNELGYYHGDSIPVMLGQGIVSAMTIDCIGNEIVKQDFFNSGNEFFIFDFQICTDSTSTGDCTNLFWFVNIDSTTFEFFGDAMPFPADEYMWDFGDGITATGQQIIHTYNPALGDVFNVTLYTHTYIPGTDTCVAYSTQELWLGNTPDCENFFWHESIDNFTFDFFGEALPFPANDYLWDFGDGTSGVGSLTTHTYETTTITDYLVTLTTLTYEPISGDTCIAISSELVTVGILNNCVANFTYNQDTINQLSVQFTDLSIGEINYWFWDFGDGLFSEDQNPIHYYEYPGSYLVCLNIISDSLGYYCSDMYCTEVLIDFSLTSNFTVVLDTVSGTTNQYSFLDLSFGNPDAWLWDFGDGNYSSDHFPIHQYPESGEYEVCLEVTKNFPSGPSITDVSCQIILTPNYYDFGGMTFLGDHPMNNVNGDTTVLDTGIAYIYRKYPDVIVPVDTNLFYQYGYYWFADVLEGDYIVKVGLTENSYHYNDYLTAYFETALSWKDANVLDLYDTNYYVNINLEEIDGIGSGPGGISGSLSVDGSCPLSSMISLQLIILLNENNIPLTFTTTNNNGEFEFNNLPFGNYKIYPELTGLSTTIESVSLNDGTVQIDGLNLELSCDISIGITDNYIEAIFAGEVYPNPVQENLHLEINVPFSQSILICIFDIQGKKVKEYLYQLNPGEQNISLNSGGLPEGFYLLSITSEEILKPIIRKFIK